MLTLLCEALLGKKKIGKDKGQQPEGKTRLGPGEKPKTGTEPGPKTSKRNQDQKHCNQEVSTTSPKQKGELSTGEIEQHLMQYNN